MTESRLARWIPGWLPGATHSLLRIVTGALFMQHGVRAGSPADKAGLRPGDVITSIGEHLIRDLQAMTDALRAHEPGDTVRVRIRREGAEQTLSVTLGSRDG